MVSEKDHIYIEFGQPYLNGQRVGATYILSVLGLTYTSSTLGSVGNAGFEYAGLVYFCDGHVNEPCIHLGRS